ncbi:MAG TPA: response regulator transcription factor [Rudaea sp.]|jgi:NarL family two-component system response regulator LiaR
MNAPVIRVVIADDHVLVRQGIRAFLDTHADLAIVAEAENADGAISACATLKPDVALIDLVMPGGGIAAIRAIGAASPATKSILLTSFDDARDILAAVQAGALSCLLKDIDADGLADAIRKAAQGEAVLHPRVAGYLVEAVRRGRAAPGSGAFDSLSEREREVLALIAEGASNQRIAAQLEISEKTVKTHVGNMLAKLGLGDRTQAAVYAWKSGLKKS